MNDSAPALLRGAFITLEGGEGAGKTTQQRHILAKLSERGIPAIATREPGGSPKAERLRERLLSGQLKPLGGKAEAIVFSAARIDHIEATIGPALARGTWVVCDRFADSTRAYQGTFGGVEQTFLLQLEQVTLNGLKPDLTLILDLPAEIGLARAAARRGAEASDRFESEALGSHEALRQAYLAIAASEPERCVVVDAAQDESEVAQAIWDVIVLRLRPPEQLLNGPAPVSQNGDVTPAPAEASADMPNATEPPPQEPQASLETDVLDTKTLVK